MKKSEKIKRGTLEERWRQGREINKDIGVKNESLYQKEFIRKGKKLPNAARESGVAVTVPFETLLHCPAVP